MRLLIVKLPDAAHQTVALSLVSLHDAADLVESLDDAVELLRQQSFEGAILLAGPNGRMAKAALVQLRQHAPNLGVVLVRQAARPRGAGRTEANLTASINVDPVRGKLTVGGQTVPLSQAEFRIFALLWQHRGQILSAEQLLDAIYPDGGRPGSRVLPVFLFKLRRKLSDCGLDDVVQTAVGRGFSIADGSHDLP